MKGIQSRHEKRTLANLRVLAPGVHFVGLGHPIPNVAVTGSVIFNSGFSSGVQEKHTTTDAASLFSFTGMKGRTFDYHLEKPGYATMPEGDAFDYTELVPPEKRHYPDPNNPVVLKMWKLQGAEPLVHFEHRNAVLTPDGTPKHIDLLTGRIVDKDGDMTITLVHAEAGAGQRFQRFPWWAVFSVSGGGLIASNDRLMYEAPHDSYDTIVLEQTGQEPNYDKGMDRKFFVKTKEGCYGRMTLHLNCDTSPDYPSYALLNWWLNPKPGSRNLEFDPAKVVKPTER